MNSLATSVEWESLSYEEKNRMLYKRQTKLLAEFLEHGAITKEQYEKSFHDLTEKMMASKEKPGL